MNSSNLVPSVSPEPFFMALSILSFGILSTFAFSTALLRDILYSISGPPSLVATIMALACFVKILPLLASCLPFLFIIFPILPTIPPLVLVLFLYCHTNRISLLNLCISRKNLQFRRLRWHFPFVFRTLVHGFDYFSILFRYGFPFEIIVNHIISRTHLAFIGLPFPKSGRWRPFEN